MSSGESGSQAQFDHYAAHYDEALAAGLSVSGEDKTYFARGRVAWLARRLTELDFVPATLIEFGCGTGSNAPFLAEITGVKSIVGLDISEASLELAKRRSTPYRNIHFLNFKEHNPDGKADAVFCNGVFHHIPLRERGPALQYILRSLRPGGLFAIWEN